MVCHDDADCVGEAQSAACRVPPGASGSCDSSALACDVECMTGTDCRSLGADYECTAGRCRATVGGPGATSDHDAAPNDAGPAGVVGNDAGPIDAGPPDLSTLPTCDARPVLAGACVSILEGPGDFGNCSPPLVGTIVAMGAEEARPDCFGSGNWGRAIPNSAPEGQAPIVPEGTLWWRVDDGMGNLWTIGAAAPGLSDLGVAVGDQISFKHGVSFWGYFGSSGNAQIDIQWRGRVVLAVNDSSIVRVVGEGPAECARTGACAGYEWAMRVDLGGAEIIVPPGTSVTLGDGSVLTNARAFTQGPGYDADAGDDSCGPKIDFVAALVVSP